MDAIRENNFTVNDGELCSEDLDDKSVWILKLGFDYDLSNLPQAVPISCFKPFTAKDTSGVLYAPSRSTKELKQCLGIAGEMTFDECMESEQISMIEEVEEESLLQENEETIVKSERSRKKKKRQKNPSNEELVETPRLKRVKDEPN